MGQNLGMKPSLLWIIMLGSALLCELGAMPVSANTARGCVPKSSVDPKVVKNWKAGNPKLGTSPVSGTDISKVPQEFMFWLSYPYPIPSPSKTIPADPSRYSVDF